MAGKGKTFKYGAVKRKKIFNSGLIDSKRAKNHSRERKGAGIADTPTDQPGAGVGAGDLDRSPNEPDNPSSFAFIECLVPEEDTTAPTLTVKLEEGGEVPVSDIFSQNTVVGGSTESAYITGEWKSGAAVRGTGAGASSSRSVAVVAPRAPEPAPAPAPPASDTVPAAPHVTSFPASAPQSQLREALSRAPVPPNMHRQWPAMYLDTEKVIKEVSLRALLWDPSHTLYTNRDAHQASWRSVCREVVPDFDDVSDEIQKKTELLIQKRWRSARDSYVKMKDSLTEDSMPPKTAPYSSMLSFLDTTLEYAARATATRAPAARATSTRTPATRAPAGRATATRAPAAAPHASTARNKGKPPTKRPASPTALKTEDMSPFESQLLECLRGEFGALPADDRDFFKSLGPVLKTFSRTQKLSFRSKVLAIVTEMKSEDLGEGSPSSSPGGQRDSDMSLELDLDDSSCPEDMFTSMNTPDE